MEIDGPAGFGGAVLTYTVMLNGAPTAITVAIPVTGAQGLVTGFAIPVILTDKIGVRVTKSGFHPIVTGITALVGFA